MTQALPRRMWLLAFWLVPALVATLGFALVPSALNPTISLAEILLAQMIIWLAWGLWSLLILAVGDRFPFERGRTLPAIAVHLPLTAVVISAQAVFVLTVATWFGLREPLGLESKLFIGVRLYGDFFTVIYWAIVGAHAAFRWYGAWQAQAVLAARLREDLAAAQLATLRGQLHPHFLFNALNSAVALIDRDPKEGQRMVVRLADLLRTTLRVAERQEVPLGQDLDIVRQYLEIETIRFADRLDVAWEIDPAAERALVPPFALQPLVENALRHGIAPEPRPGFLAIGARRVGDTLQLVVRNSGGPVHGGPGEGGGIGLSNLRARLDRLYGPDTEAGGRVTLRLSPEGGAEASIRIPWRQMDGPARGGPSPAASTPPGERLAPRPMSETPTG